MVDLLISLLIPSLILMKLSGEANLGADGALILALAFPFSWGAFELIKYRKFNFIALLGLISVLLTGGIGLLKLDNQWLAIKEAAIPGLIGIAVLVSTRTRYTLIRTLLFNKTVLNVDKIHDRLEKAGNTEKAKEAYGKVAKEYTFGQTYDPGQKLFWKPAEAAKEKLMMIEKGLDLDFNDLSSSTLVRKAWESLSIKHLDAVEAYVNKVTSLYADKAKAMQSELKEYAWESKEKIFSYWALNDVGTAYFVLGEVNRLNNRHKEALAAYKTLIDNYSFAQCWDPQGWFWKPAEAAQQKVIELEAMMGSEEPAAKTFNK